MRPLLLLFLLLVGEAAAAADGGANTSGAAPITPIPRELYHSSGSLLSKIEALVSQYSDRLTTETLRSSDDGYNAEIVVVTYDLGKKLPRGVPKLRVLLSFGQHGRELITSEVALRLLYILTGYHVVSGMDTEYFEKLLEKLVLKVAPIENLNGRRLVESGELCERRNGRGVDLNRNWSVDWGKKEKDYDPYEEYPGVAPFSEPESRIMKGLARSFSPHVWVNVHSGMEALFMPYDHKNVTPGGQSSRLMMSLLEDVNRRHFHGECLVGSGGGSVGYLAHGTTTDYMYDIAKVPITFTFEIYGDQSASMKDCFKMFNPVEKIVFDTTVNKWCLAFLLLFKRVLRVLESGLLVIPRDSDRSVSFEGFLLDGGRQIDGLELGIQELRSYFRLFMISSFLLLFMFCSKILKGKRRDLGLANPT